MDQEQLLSKKELLDLTGISYGQLYRWKRKNLIPEAWFIRKSTFTGQETFFPKEKILARIAQIKDMKDDLSLDQLANMFSPNPDDVVMDAAELIGRNIVTKVAADLYLERYPTDSLTFEQLLTVYVTDVALKTGEVNLTETSMLMQVLHNAYKRFEQGNARLIFVRKLGVPLCVLTSSMSDCYFDDDTRVVLQLDLAECVEALKLRLGEGGSQHV